MPLTFSIVINTLNRGKLLAKTLESFRWLKYDGDFEVIVVNGPSTDNSQEVIDSWLPHIRAGRCEVANLSISRNIGICMARGDIVAFIDDDAIPEPEWLTQLARAYTDSGIGGAGGLVFDQSGYTYQYEYSTANRLANANWKLTKSAEHFSFPQSFEFPYLQGTNASFRRSALLEVGGFDEELEYYLDETELCCRLIDAGYVIRQLGDAYVHHKFAPSNIRDEHKITRYRYPVIKNKVYFSIKHGRAYMPLSEILADNKAFSDQQANDIEFHIAGGRLQPSEREVFAEQNERAWERGLSRGLSGVYEYITPEKQARWEGEFLPFKTLSHPAPQSIVLVSRDFPPNHGGGIATFNKDLAEALAAQGHTVCVITQSPDINRVDLEHGVWVHRMVMRDMPMPAEAAALQVPQHVWNWSAIALEEAARIATHRPIDVVETPIWDCEGIAFLLNGAWPLVTSLQTTLHFWLESHPESRSDAAWMGSFGRPMLALEKKMMQESDAIRSISSAIARDIEQAYDFRFSPQRLVIAPLGMPDVSAPASDNIVAGGAGGPLEVLFVGRLEYRKGIDVLLEAIPDVLAGYPEVRFRIIGDDSLPAADGRTYKEHFLGNRANKDYFDRVRFEGKTDQQTLLDAYRRCDLLVAPSRFESFGLIFVEAMREGRPVIGCKAGGMPEVVSADVNGILVTPGDRASLVEALKKLIGSRELRETMGAEGRRLYLERFTAHQMAIVSGQVYATAKATHEGGM